MSAVRYVSGESTMLNLLEMSCFFFYSSASFDHVNTSVRCTLEESCGQSAARPFIDLFTSIFLLALLKLFTSDTLLYILQDPRELWLRPL